MEKIDSHQHFWLFDPVRDSWITDDMAVIQKDFLPNDLLPVLQQNNISGCVAVQANQSEQENTFLLDLAKNNPFIKGVVGWVDFKAADIESRLKHYQQYEKMKGFRHVLQGEADDRFMLNEEFMRGISHLHHYGFTYDILIMPRHLVYANELVKAFPEQRFVIDHLAKPFIKNKQIDPWKKDMEAVASNENVYCKVSGFCTEADWATWQLSDIKPYLDVIFDAFGSNRVMFGSDWPVCLVAGGYERTVQALEEYVSMLTPTEQALFWGGNASTFYKLDN